MKALSLTQPWSSLVSLCEKHFETRSWGTRFRGRLAIHASKGFPGHAQCAALSWPFREVLHEHGLRVADLPLGAVVATCVVADCRRIDPADPQPALDWFNAHAARHDRQFGDYTLGRFMWLLADVVALPAPVPAKGALGLWAGAAGAARRLPALLAAQADLADAVNGRSRMSERQLQEAVEQCARLFGWEVYHTWLSARSAPGFPDILAVRAGRLVAIELKSASGKLTEAQTRWLGALGGVPCCEVHIFRPVDWLEGRIEDVLR